MPGDELDPLVDELVGDRHRLLRVAGVVADLEHQLLADDAAGLALMSLTAISAPRFICSPKTAYWPVIGPAVAIVMSAHAAPPPSRTSAAAPSKHVGQRRIMIFSFDLGRLTADHGGTRCRPLGATVRRIMAWTAVRLTSAL